MWRRSPLSFLGGISGIVADETPLSRVGTATGAAGAATCAGTTTIASALFDSEVPVANIAIANGESEKNLDASY